MAIRLLVPVLLVTTLMGAMTGCRTTAPGGAAIKDQEGQTTPAPFPETGVYILAEKVVLDFINAAQSTLDIGIYEIRSKSVADAIVRAVEDRGVKLRMVAETRSVGNICGDTFTVILKRDQAYKDLAASGKSHDQIRSELCDYSATTKLKAAGAKIVPFAAWTQCPPNTACMHHGKVIIADGSHLLLSSGNFSPTNLGTDDKVRERDYLVVTKSQSAINTVSKAFRKDFYRDGIGAVEGVAAQEAQTSITISPFAEGRLIEFLKSAQSSIIIENQAVYHDPITNVLIELSKPPRNIDVTVVTADPCFWGQLNPAAVKTAERLLQEGNKIRVYGLDRKRLDANGLSPYVHSKAIVVDNTKAWIGSVNFSYGGLKLQREYGKFLNTSEAAQLVPMVQQLTAEVVENQDYFFNLAEECQ